MARFRFALQPVLEHREMIAEEKQRLVAGIERERAALEDEIRACQAGLARERGAMRGVLAAATGLDIGAARTQAAASFRYVTRAQAAVVKLAGAHKRLEAARRELVKATTEKRAVEILRDRRLEEWKAEQARREAAELDGLMVMRAARREDTL